ncbi:MAG: Bug family tripartite tricarboxylate transporter substrate binding protein [Hydrogenophaga sp.]|uniref:Bug family tripartite tricarboxylate transporter substrate binding protein n=1 Tax=Hydrogenophaga sp. TaxID=1904254 RepID=UPI0040361954
MWTHYKIQFKLRAIFSSLCLCAVAVGPGAVLAQTDFPNRPVKIVVPYPPGGPTDAVARLYAKELGDKLGQPFVVENKPGAGTNIGAEMVAKSAPDGHTLLVVQAASHGVNPSLFKNLSYDALKDFVPVGQMARTAMFLLANKSAPFNSAKELVAYAKANPGKLMYGSQGNGAPGHLAGALLGLKTGISTVHVPYRGAAPALTDLAVGSIQFAFLSYDGAAQGMVKEGRLKVLAVATPERWPTEAQIPSMAEEGVENFQVLSFFGLGAPAKTPEPALEKLSKAMLEIGARDDIKKKVMELGLYPMSMTRPEMTTFIAREIEYWRPVVKAAGITVD